MGEGKYAAAKKVTTKAGKPLSEESAQTPCLGDWDGDGDFDMAVGFIQGPVKLYLNNGDLTYTEKGTFKANGKPIEAGDGGPCLTDWDGDGTLDMLLGDGEGSVMFYRGTKKGSLELATDENAVILKKQEDAWQVRRKDSASPVGFSPPYPGARTKPFAADWNGDGKLDLLVGDYIQLEPEKVNLTDAQREELKRIEARQQKISKTLSGRYQTIQAQALKRMGVKDMRSMTQAQQQKFYKFYSEEMEKDKEFKKLQQESMDMYRRSEALSPREAGTGVVWVYLRK